MSFLRGNVSTKFLDLKDFDAVTIWPQARKCKASNKCSFLLIHIFCCQLKQINKLKYLKKISHNLSSTLKDNYDNNDEDSPPPGSQKSINQGFSPLFICFSKLPAIRFWSNN